MDLTPEQMQLLLELGSADDQQAQLQRQQQQLLALRNRPAREHRSPFGAAIGGLGDMLDTYRSHRDERGIEAQQKALQDKRTQGRKIAGEYAMQPMDILTLLDPGNQPTPEQQQAAMDQIAKRQRAATLFGLSGDSVLGQLGGQMSKEAQFAQGQIGDAGAQRLKMRMAQEERAAQEEHRRQQAELEAQRLAESARHNRTTEGIDRSRVDQDSWSMVPNPNGSGFAKYNKKTGEYVVVEGTPGQLGKPTEKQRNDASAAKRNAAKLDLALSTLDQHPGAYGGVGNFIGGAVEKASPGFVAPAVQSINAQRFSPGELQAKNFITNVVSEIIKERSGGNVTLNEELRQKFLPQETDSLAVVRQKLQDLRTWEALTFSTLTGQEQGVPPPAVGPQTRDAPPMATGATVKAINPAAQKRVLDTYYTE